ncbi:RICIN domain-containing protein [Streptomyces sp. NPDC006430]|uniref:RICIN domain-containing protein n=1 Tax=Streptomyces sp. NPDC006430 TaxID=3154299 RepID=UPI00339F8593
MTATTPTAPSTSWADPPRIAAPTAVRGRAGGQRPSARPSTEPVAPIEENDSEFGVRTYNCLGNDHQKWNVHQWADGTRELRNVKTGLCLDDSPAHHLRTFPCGTHSQKSPYQTWR